MTMGAGPAICLASVSGRLGTGTPSRTPHAASAKSRLVGPHETELTNRWRAPGERTETRRAAAPAPHRRPGGPTNTAVAAPAAYPRQGDGRHEPVHGHGGGRRSPRLALIRRRRHGVPKMPTDALWGPRSGAQLRAPHLDFPRSENLDSRQVLTGHRCSATHCGSAERP